jgi:AraC-like DNA-binding protein
MRPHRILSGRGDSAGKISPVAYGCGFGDVSYFNRTFRRHYGAASSDVRALSEGNRS